MTFREIMFNLVVLSTMAVTIFAIMGFGVRRLLLRRLIQIAGCIAALPVFLFALIWAIAIFIGPTKQTSLKSPGGHYAARLRFNGGGATSKDYASVSVRPSWSPVAEEVYTGTYEPRIHWLDERTLEIRYPLQIDKTSCGGSWVGVRIVCKEKMEERD
jgi:hypothetical protein